MFDERRQKPAWMSKALTICAVGMGVGFGTCGVVVFTRAGDGQVWTDVAIAGSILFFACLLGMVVVGVSMLVERRRR